MSNEVWLLTTKREVQTNPEIKKTIIAGKKMA